MSTICHRVMKIGDLGEKIMQVPKMTINLFSKFFLRPSVGLKPRVPEKQRTLFSSTKNFEQFRFQSVWVPIPKLEVPPDFEPKWS